MLQPASLLGKVFAPRQLAPALAALAKISLFHQLSASELGIVAGLLHDRDFLADEVVFDQGEVGQALYLITSGEIALWQTLPGKAEKIAVLGPGAFFGDMALIDHVPRSAQARASQTSRLAVLFREDFLGLMDTHARIASKIALQLAREMGRRLRNQTGLEPSAWQPAS